MPQPGLIYRVLVASPSDVAIERQIITEVIHEWNAIYSFSRAAILEPIKWETHAYPEMGDRPQELINKQFVGNCDLLIGAFWTRLGTDTGKAASGTVEEIEQMREMGKPVLLYFSSKPAVLSSVDPVQYQALVEYKQTLKPEGLCWDYQDVPDFQKQLQKHLAMRMDRLHPGGKPALPEPSVPPPTLPMLSAEAKELLANASQDSDGLVAIFHSMTSDSVQTNGYAWGGTGREWAQWKGAVDQLLTLDLLEYQGGSLYRVTAEGYKVADRINVILAAQKQAGDGGQAGEAA